MKTWFRPPVGRRTARPAAPRTTLRAEQLEGRDNPSRLFLPTNLSGLQNTTVTVPVQLEVAEAGGYDVISYDLVINFDPSRFSVSNPRKGAGVSGLGTPTENIDNAAGTFVYNVSGSSTVHLNANTTTTLMLFDVFIKPTAAAGASTLDLRADTGGAGSTPTNVSFFTEATGDSGEIPLNPAPTNTPNDANVDGSIRVLLPLAVTDVVDVAPDPRNTAVPSVDVTFNGPINPATFDAADVTLTRNGTNVPLSNLTFTQVGGTDTYTVGGLAPFTGADGTYVLTVTGAGVNDPSGNTGSGTASDTFVVDATAPAAPVITGVADDTGASTTDGITSDTTLVINGTAEANSAVTITQAGVGVIGTTTATAGGTFSFTVPTLAEGTYQFTAAAADAAGNTSAASTPFNVTVDTTAPVTPAITGFSTDTGTIGDGITADTTLTLTGTAEANSTVTITQAGVGVIGTTTATAGGTFSFDYTTALTDGTYQFTAAATDLAGNPSQSSAAFSVTVDATAPATPVITSVDDDTGTAGDGLTRDNTLTVTGTAEAGSTVTIRNGTAVLGTAVATGGTYTVTTAALADGTYSLTATATDAAGNPSQSSAPPVVVTVDTAAPVGPTITGVTEDRGASTTDGVTNDNTLVITGTAEANSSVTVLLDGSSIGTVTATAGGTFSLNYTTTTLGDGTYNLTATATDRAGNAGTAGPTFVLTVDTAAPAAPTIGSVDDDTGTAGDGLTRDNTLTVTGTAEAGSTVTIRNGTTVLGTAVATGGTYTVTTGVLADGTYNLTATAVDLAGNSGAASAPVTVTVDATAPAAPAITGVADDTGISNSDRITQDNRLTISGTAEPNSTVTVRVNGTSVGTATADATTGAFTFNYPVAPTDPALADGTYTFTATATDAAGNTSPASAAVAVTVDTAAPAAPAITGVADDTGASTTDRVTSDTTLTLTGTAEPNSTVTVTRVGAGVIGTATATAGGTFTFTTTALADGTYSFTAAATDRAGNVSTASTAFTVTVDTAAPAAPAITAVTTDSGTTTPSGTTSDNTLTVTGTAEANSTVTIRNGATVIGTATATAGGTFTFTTPALPDGTYTFTATAADPAGNAGPASAPSDTFVVDATGPTVTIGAIDPARLADGVTVVFSEPIAAGTFTVADLSLARDGAAVSTAGLTITPSGDGRTFRIGGLDAAAQADGTYAFGVNLGGVTDALGNAGSGTAARSFAVGSAGTSPPVSVDPSPVPQFAVGTDRGTAATVSYYNPDRSLRFSVPAFPSLPGFTGGARTAVGDFNGDSVPDVVVGTGPGAAAFVRILDGKTGAEIATLSPFEGFTGGVFVAVGDLDGDGTNDVILSPDEGGGPRVLVYSGGKSFQQVASFFGINDPNFRGGARVALGDLDGDGKADLAVAAGFGGGPRVAVFDGRTFMTTRTKLLNDFFVFDDVLRNGVYLAIGDLDGDNFGDLIVGAGPGGGPRVLALSGRQLLNNGPVAALSAPLGNFFAGDPANRSGVRLSTKDLDGDNKDDLIVGPGTGAGSRLTAYLGKDFTGGTSAPPAFSLDAFTDNGGIFLG